MLQPKIKIFNNEADALKFYNEIRDDRVNYSAHSCVAKDGVYIVYYDVWSSNE